MFVPYYLRRRPPDASRYEKMTTLEHWLTAGMNVTDIPGASETLEVDMSACSVALKEVRNVSDVPITYTIFFVRAVALALNRLPQLHIVAAGNTRYFPENVDIGLSVANEQFAVPALVLKNCASRSIIDLAREVKQRIPEIRKIDAARGKMLQRIGWIIPLDILRRAILRFAGRFIGFRQAAAGTFHITHVPYVDFGSPLRLMAVAAISIGQVKERVIAVNGAPAVRETALLTCTFNHNVWDGMCAAALLNEVKSILEKPDAELIEPSHAQKEHSNATQ